jgi:hypothetical protein
MHPRRRNGSKKIPNVKLRPSTSRATREDKARASKPADEEDGELGEHLPHFLLIGDTLNLFDASWIKWNQAMMRSRLTLSQGRCRFVALWCVPPGIWTKWVIRTASSFPIQNN